MLIMNIIFCHHHYVEKNGSEILNNVKNDEESVENAEKLVRDLAEQFDAADARLRADALKLKATWDDLQLQAYDAFVRGEASRADTARAAADGAALSLVHLQHEASQESTD